MRPTTSIAKAEPGLYGFTMKATTPSGRQLIIAILHATWDMELSGTVNTLTSPERRLGCSCFYARADDASGKSDALHFKFDDMRELISHLDTL